MFVLGWLMFISYLQATGISLFVGTAIGGNAPNRWHPAKQPVPSPRRRTADAIIERNAFDSVAEPLVVQPSAPSAAFTSTDPLSAPQCDSPRVVIVTEARDPKWSVAALQTALDLRPRDHRVGDQVAGKTVEFIGYNPKQSTPSVWLSSTNGLCQTSLFAARPKPVDAAVSVRDQPTKTAPAGILERSLLRQVRVVPERKGSSVVGIRLFGIRPDSLLGILGLENGDRLESINGFSLGTPEQALAAYAHLRTANRLAVSIERHGKPLTVAYRID